jgi:hypothetical protein
MAGTTLNLPTMVTITGRGSRIATMSGKEESVMISPDATAKHCHDKAEECMRMAEIATSSDIAEMYRKTAQRWLQVAAKSEAAHVGASYMPTRIT